MATLVLIRHGESQWNLENRFTGWIDIPLTDKGREEARLGGEKINGIKFDKAYTSVLQRAIETLTIILKVIGQEKISIEKVYPGYRIGLPNAAVTFSGPGPTYAEDSINSENGPTFFLFSTDREKLWGKNKPPHDPITCERVL